MASVMNATENNLLNGDQAMASAAITPASVASGAPTAFLLLPGSPVASGVGGITGLDDTGDNGISPVPAQVFDQNFGANYSVLYSPENLPGSFNFEGGLGTDQYTGYQGDPGNFGGLQSNLSLADQLSINNQEPDTAYTQYACSQAINDGNLAAPIQQLQAYAQLAAGEAPPNAGGDPVAGAAEIVASPGIDLVKKVIGGAAFLASLAALPETAGVLLGVAAATALAQGIAGDIVKGQGAHPGAGYFIPQDANTQTFLNDAGRVAAQMGAAAAAMYAERPYVSEYNGGQGGNSVGRFGASTNLLASAGGIFTTNASGHPIFTVQPHA